jgi:heat shock protein HslJ
MTHSSARIAAALVLTITTASVLSACGGDDGSAPGASSLVLSGRTFVGDMVTADGVRYDLVPDSTLRLAFSDGQISASAGCNTMSGPATWSDGTLSLDGALASTEMACRPSLMKQDTWLADVLSSQPALTLRDATLTVDGGATAITLTDQEVAVPDATFTGTNWQLESILRRDTASSLPAGVSASVVFSEDGTLNTNLGCNVGNGSYTTDGDTLDVGPLMTTKRACDQSTSEVESAMLGALDGTSSFGIDGDQLTLTPQGSTGDEAVLVFRAGEQDAG